MRVTLAKNISGVEVTHRIDKLLVALVEPMVLGPKKSTMVVPPFRLLGPGNQFILVFAKSMRF